MKYLFFLVFVLFSMAVLAKDDLKYPCAAIPDTLKKNAALVVRESIEKLSVMALDDAEYKVNKAFTVLNENGRKHAGLVVFYDNRSKVKGISGTVYDKDGNVIDKIKNKDIHDFSAISGFSIFEENRVKYIKPGEYEFPFTIEYEYEVQISDFFTYPSWQPVKDKYIAVQHASYEVALSKGLSLQYHESNLPEPAFIEEHEKFTNYKWELHNFPRIKPEVFSPVEASYFPMLLVAPVNFQMYGYEGNLSSWKSFGKWVWELNEERNKLSETEIEKVKVLTKGVTDPMEKIRILYEHLQKSCRYVSIQIGIGGWQPMDVKDVCRLAYGDCKALSNYMQSMLEIVDIESYCTLVMAGKEVAPLVESFPAPQFNHEILTVVLPGDTLWLECTSQDNPPGFIGSFTDDRRVLLLKPDGGELIRTKAYLAEENLQSRKAVVRLNLDGASTAKVQTNYGGVHYNDVMRIVNSDQKDKQSLLYNRYDLPGFTIGAVSHKVIKSRNPMINESIELELKNIVTQFGNRLILSPNLFNKVEIRLDEEKPRTLPIQINRSYYDVDTLIYEFPEGYDLVNESQAIDIESQFGRYHAEIKMENDQLIYIRERTIYKGIHDASAYSDLVQYYKAVYNADDIKLAFVKK